MASYVVVATAQDNGMQSAYGPYRSREKAERVEAEMRARLDSNYSGADYDPDTLEYHMQVCQLDRWSAGEFDNA